jgi:acyl-CoA synthetase (AMP-forming)/AMP-acid ligase II
MKFQTLNEVIIGLIAQHPEKGIGFIEPDGQIKFIGFRQIYEQALRILSGLRNRNLSMGSFALIALDKNEEIIPSLWACFLGGVIPSLLQAPMSFSSHNLQAAKLENIWNLMNQPHMIVSDKAFHAWRELGKDFHFLNFDALTNNAPDHHIAKTHPEDLAYIQFSSGSTGNPKGVMLTNNNMLSNIHDIATANRFQPSDVSLNWMPLFHDMGLVGFHLTPIYVQSTHYFIDTINFVKNPSLWLDSISNLRVEVTAAPNFGQALTLRHLARKKNESWDFSSVTSFFNGAEPISADIMTRFIDEMAVFGFRDTAMIPCYGMAEATLAISMRTKAVSPTITLFDRIKLFNNKIAVETQSQEEGIKLVGVGQVLGHTRIRIVDETGNILPDKHVGHIHIKGDNVTKQFYKPDVDEVELFNEGWLLTGDMGLVYNGELYITGRAKDLIIINGQNYYAHDLEQVIVQSKPELYGKIACVSVFDQIIGREKLIAFVVGPSDPKHFDQYRDIGKAFHSKLGIYLDEIIPVSSAEIHRTSSGKLQRYKLVHDYEKDLFKGHSKIFRPTTKASKGLPDIHTNHKL